MTRKQSSRGKGYTERHDRKAGWEHSHNWASKVRGRRERLRRSKIVGSNDKYYYHIGQNLNLYSGKVVRPPRPAGLPGKEFVWFRIGVPNQDRRGQWLFLPVRCQGALAYYVYSTIDHGDVVTVVGRLWSGKMPEEGKKGGKMRQFNWLQAEMVSGSHPVAIDKDPRYVKVRVDLFNRLCSLTEDMHPHRIPIPFQRELGLDDPPPDGPSYNQVELDVDENEDDEAIPRDLPTDEDS